MADTKILTAFFTENGKGIYMWKYFLSLFTTNIRNVWDKTDSLEAENKKLNDRITILEGLLDVKTEPIATPMYECSYREPEECPGGLSSVNPEGLQTRCYNPFMLGWKTCTTGWKLQMVVLE